MKHRSLTQYVTLYNVCKQGGKEMYYYVDTQPERRLQDKNLKEFFKQIEEHGYDVISPSDKDYEQIVKAYNVVSKRDAVKDDMSSYTHYKPEAIPTDREGQGNDVLHPCACFPEAKRQAIPGLPQRHTEFRCFHPCSTS